MNAPPHSPHSPSSRSVSGTSGSQEPTENRRGWGGGLSPTQAATRARVIDAAVRLATERGYDGFTMRDVAARAGVSPATAYLYYSSKDALLVDALVERGQQTTDAVARRRDDRPLDVRINAAFAGVVRACDAAPLLYQAMFRGYVSRPTEGESPWSGRSWLDRAVDADVADREAVVEVLQALVLSSMIALIGGSPASDVLARFRRSTSIVCRSV